MYFPYNLLVNFITSLTNKIYNINQVLTLTYNLSNEFSKEIKKKLNINQFCKLVYT